MRYSAGASDTCHQNYFYDRYSILSLSLNLKNFYRKGFVNMLMRRLFLYLSQAKWARFLVTHFFLARRMARRFVAGETLDEAIAVSKALNTAGLSVTLDYLGESVTHADETVAVRKMYLDLLENIHKNGLNASISLKLTHMGLDIGEELCVSNLRHILNSAKSYRIPVTIDMEGSAYTDVTLRLYRTLRDEYEFGRLIGTVIQSMLYRSVDDMRQLGREGARIRLVKGAYLEPESIAHPQKADVDNAYIAIMRDYFAHTPPAYLELGTHDEKMISQAIAIASENGVDNSHYEIQMLYGIRRERQTELAKAGIHTRVYVPFGEAWYPYFMRRLAERPANVWFLMRSVFRK
jgi:proline dehydrogenase